MKMKQKRILISAFFVLSAGLVSFSLALSGSVDTVTAQGVCLDRNGQDVDCDEPGAQPHPETGGGNKDDGLAVCDDDSENCCGDVETSIIGGDFCDDNQEGGVIFGLLKWVLRIMTAGVGIAAVGGIAYGALLYTTAENKPEQTKKAIGVITNVVVGIVAYALMAVFLNFLIPGGIFS